MEGLPVVESHGDPVVDLDVVSLHLLLHFSPLDAQPVNLLRVLLDRLLHSRHAVADLLDCLIVFLHPRDLLVELLRRCRDGESRGRVCLT